MIDLIVTLTIYGLIFYLLYWAVSQIPEPFHTVGRVLLVLVAVLLCLRLIGPLTGVHLP